MKQKENELERHVETWSILREVEKIEAVEDNIQSAIDKWHAQGLNYWTILKIFCGFIQRLIMQADAEFWRNLN